jgi:hypothetical protein
MDCVHYNTRKAQVIAVGILLSEEGLSPSQLVQELLWQALTNRRASTS